MKNIELRNIQAKRMWQTKNNGETFNIPIDFNHLEKLNIGRFKTMMIKKMLPDNNVNYSVLGDNVFIHESHGGDDWQQNFMAFTVKVKLLGEYVKVHAGFYLTAMSIFYHMKENGLLNNNLNFDAYSHGAGAAPLLALRIADFGCTIPRIEGNQEPPRCIFRPSKRIKSKCIHFVNYIQGSDIVCKVPWWMSHLGRIVKVPGEKTSWYKILLKPFNDHNIYKTKEL
jgi:hypothetical protein